MQKSLNQLVAENLMVRDVVAINPNDSIQEALTLLQENSLSSLPVIDGHSRIVGIISAKDILQWAEDLDNDVGEMLDVSPFYRDWVVSEAGKASQTAQVNQLMSDQVVTTPTQGSLASVISLMLRNQIHHLPVIDDSERLMGLISTSDVLRVVGDSLAVASPS